LPTKPLVQARRCGRFSARADSEKLWALYPRLRWLLKCTPSYAPWPVSNNQTNRAGADRLFSVTALNSVVQISPTLSGSAIIIDGISVPCLLILTQLH
jgi:hypothetical protein